MSDEQHWLVLCVIPLLYVRTPDQLISMNLHWWMSRLFLRSEIRNVLACTISVAVIQVTVVASFENLRLDINNSVESTIAESWRDNHDQVTGVTFNSLVALVAMVVLDYCCGRCDDTIMDLWFDDIYFTNKRECLIALNIHLLVTINLL